MADYGDMPTGNLMAGKRGIIMGVANKNSPGDHDTRLLKAQFVHGAGARMRIDREDNRDEDHISQGLRQEWHLSLDRPSCVKSMIRAA